MDNVLEFCVQLFNAGRSTSLTALLAGNLYPPGATFSYEMTSGAILGFIRVIIDDPENISLFSYRTSGLRIAKYGLIFPFLLSDYYKERSKIITSYGHTATHEQ